MANSFAVIIDQPSFDSSGQEEPDELSYGFSSCSNLAAVDLTKALQNGMFTELTSILSQSFYVIVI